LKSLEKANNRLDISNKKKRARDNSRCRFTVSKRMDASELVSNTFGAYACITLYHHVDDAIFTMELPVDKVAALALLCHVPEFKD
jgi:hypothetical protein